MKSDFWQGLSKVSWALLLVSLPFTSFPALSNLFGGTSVAPLSALFLVILLGVFLLPYLATQRSVPRQSLPLFGFVVVALVASALANFLPIPSFRDTALWKNALEGLITLFTGVVFYLVTTLIIQDSKQLKSAFVWINLGGIIILIACLFQAVAWQINQQYPKAMLDIQSFLTSSGLLYKNRVTGLAFEPSWLAHQLNTLYIPIWLGFSIKGFSAYKKKLFGKISIENILLVLGIVTLFLSYSRIGWLTTIFMAAYIVFRSANTRMNRWLAKKYPATNASTSKSKNIRFLAKLAMWLLLFLSLVLLILLVGVILARIDPRMGDLFDIERYRNYGFLGWASQLSFAERVIYWISGFQVFLKYPWFGVGLGGSGFFFPEVVPEFGYKLPEVIKYINVLTTIPNAKNLWVRLLSETGIAGFIFFISWIFTQWKDASFLDKHGQTSFEKTMGYVGKLFILALVIEGFSVDSFGLPYYWIAMGLITATRR